MKAPKQFAFVTFLLGSIAAVGGFLAWSLPTRGAGPASGKGPRALLQIVSRPPQLRFSNVADHEDYKRYLETQTVLIKSNLVLTSALKRPAVSELTWIKQQSDPIAWLQQNLEAINLKDSEVLQVSLRANSGASTDDQAAIINAVVRAYMDEVADVDTKQRSDRLGKLKRVNAEYREMLKERRQNLRKLSATVGIDRPLTRLDRQELSRLYHNLRTQRVNLRLEWAEAETLLARRKQGEGNATEQVRKEIAHIEDRLAVLNARQTVLDEELNRVQLEMRGAANQALDLETLKAEVSQMEDTSGKIGAEVEALTVELEGTPRVRIIGEAIPPRQ